MSRAADTADADGVGGVIETPPPRQINLDDAETTDRILPGASAQRVRKPLLAWERQLPKIYLVLLVVAVGALLFFPRVASAYNVTLALTVLLTIVLATSWNIISGFTGYVSFGHAGFFGIGSYIGALLIFNEVMSWIPAMIVAGLGTAFVALVIGYPTLRLRGPYFAITMLGLSELARIVVTAWDSVTRGGLGVYLPILRDQPPPTYYGMIALAVVAVVVSYAVGTSTFGLRLLSIRDDEVAAQAMGIDTTRYKMAAFTLSSFFPGIAGAIYAYHVGFIDPAAVFTVLWTIRSIASAIVGGQATILG
ncbi:MAG: transporter permease, partial [Thermomicrobiales bacterium]|nr:transporter permease [Thermomicrobiales bacterium]